MAVARSLGEGDWNFGSSTGRLTTNLTSVQPYLRWSDGGTAIWATAGGGTGTADATDDGSDNPASRAGAASGDVRPKPRVGVLRRGLALGLVALSTLVVAAQSPSLVLSETSLDVPEAGSASYTVKLATLPTADVAVYSACCAGRRGRRWRWSPAGLPRRVSLQKPGADAPLAFGESWEFWECVGAADAPRTVVAGVRSIPNHTNHTFRICLGAEITETKDGIRVRFHSKTAALDSLGKHLGMFLKRVEFSFDRLTPDELLNLEALTRKLETGGPVTISVMRGAGVAARCTVTTWR